MRSLMSLVIKGYFWLTRSKYRFYNDSMRIEEGTFTHQEECPISKYIDNYVEEIIAERRVYIFNDKKDPNQNVFFYYHGGGYLNPITKYHWKFLRKIAKNLDLKIIVPIYERVPERSYKDEFPKLREIYEHYRSETSKNFFGGDSAGGGLAAGICYYLKEKYVPLPDALFLFSPWLDVEMLNPEIEKVKPHVQMLGYGGLNTIGRIWSDGNLRDKYCSPIYGEVENLPPVYIYTGTYDVLYPDMKKFEGMMKEKNKPLVFREYPKMEHVFIVFPLLREGKKAFKDLTKDYLEIK